MTNPLTCSEAELPRVAGSILQPNTLKHVYQAYPNKCLKCKKEMFAQTGEATGEAKKACSIADHIKLTWDNAMKWRDWAVDLEKPYFMDCVWDKACDTVWRQFREGSFEPRGKWYLAFAQPHHYIRAACICKLNSEKGKA